MSNANPSRIAGSNLLSGLLFVAFVTVGCCYIVISKYEQFNPFLVTSVPVFVMIGYAAMMMFARALRLRDDQAGDNLYYMGFLFTLTSLSVSLYQFSAAGSAEEIVQNFGIAIASTISGIALRILFHQMRSDPVEVEATARLELAEASRRVRSELDATVLEFNYFRRTTQQTLSDSIEELAKSFAEMRSGMGLAFSDLPGEIRKPLEETSRRSSNLVDELSKHITESLSEVSERLVRETDHFSKRAGLVVLSIEKMASKLDSMQTPDQIIEIKLSPMIQGLSKAVNAFNKGAELQEKAINENSRQTQELVAALGRFTEGLRVREPSVEQSTAATPWGQKPIDPRRVE